MECGTHVVTAAEVAPYGHSEQAIAAQMLPAKVVPGMLVLADRNFYGFKLWRITCASGAKLAWRVKSNLKLPVEQMLSDGSYLSTVFDSEDRHRRAGQIVRVIDYTLQDSATPAQDSYRLVSNILEPAEAPALELPRCTTSAGRSKASSTSSRRTCAPTARCCAARRPIWSYKSCGGCCWRTSPSAS